MRQAVSARGWVAQLSKLHFFLGGRDLEMLEIARLLARHAPGQVTDRGLAWGARLSDYASEIEAAVAAGATAVAVELTDDMPADWPPRRRLVEIDHHGAKAGADMPCSLRQVFDMLELPLRHWTRWRVLVAANDVGHIAGMRAIGARASEIRRIRAADRCAQGVTAADEAEARRAIAATVTNAGLTFIETRANSSSAITDFLQPELGGQGYDNLLVAMPSKVAFYGDGRIVKQLARHFAGSWWGGALPERGFWGMNATGEPNPAALAATIRAWLAKH